MSLSHGVGMRLSQSFSLPDPIRPPIDIQHNQRQSQPVMGGVRIPPGFVIIGPCNFGVVGEFRLIAFFELLFPLDGFGLRLVIFVVPAPIVVVVVVESECFLGSSEH